MYYRGNYSLEPEFPSSLGYEVVGTVTSVGERSRFLTYRQTDRNDPCLLYEPVSCAWRKSRCTIGGCRGDSPVVVIRRRSGRLYAVPDCIRRSRGICKSGPRRYGVAHGCKLFGWARGNTDCEGSGSNLHSQLQELCQRSSDYWISGRTT
ncbi:hypothetical protein [Edaphobacter sp. HDX4]|uniref:hypothetical protein n=1 Tax=Edaphobacter sp. HDX4 TaxID=2794064 RepID=UPI002FE5309E